VKDLETIGNRNKEDMIIVDNYIYSFSMDICNGIPIKPFFNDKEDRELCFLGYILERLKSYEDCSRFIEREFSLSKLYEHLVK